jgi:hypothetical protein
MLLTRNPPEVSMRNIWTIAKREYNHYFISPIAYVVAFMLLLTIGIIFAINILYFIQNAFQSFGQTPDVSSLTGAFAFLLVLSVPALTMRLISDEARIGNVGAAPYRQMVGSFSLHYVDPWNYIDLSSCAEFCFG